MVIPQARQGDQRGPQECVGVKENIVLNVIRMILPKSIINCWYRSTHRMSNRSLGFARGNQKCIGSNKYLALKKALIIIESCGTSNKLGNHKYISFYIYAKRLDLANFCLLISTVC